MATLSNSFDSRKVKNSLARWSITIGGISVLFVLVLIFLYLLYVIKPIFESATVEKNHNLVTQSTDVLAVGIDEQQEIAYQIDSKGIISFYQAKEASGRKTGDLISEQQLTSTSLKSVFSTANQQHVLLDADGQVFVVKVKFTSSYPNDIRQITPSISYPLGEDALPIDADGNGIINIGFVMNDERAIFISQTDDMRILFTTLTAEDDFAYDAEFQASHFDTNIATVAEKADDILVSPDMRLAFIRHNNQVAIYNLSEDSIELNTVLNPTSKKNHHLTSMSLLSGGSSVLLGDNLGNVSQWFEVAGDEGREFKLIRQFSVNSGKPIAHIYTEAYRKSFYAITTEGDLGIFYTTSQATLWQGKLMTAAPKAFVISPRANGVMFADEAGLQLFHVDNEHPEVTWEALWQEVWYEGYPEPDYVWQSTSASDDFEAKFSLAPISFGTMKAALYAMFFAVPIAISAAIYTAYFMTPSLRRVVKPTIEIMEALPTVILGFLAGLWLAPIAEQYLPAIFLLFLFLPLSTFVFALTWHKLPKSVKQRIPETWASLLLIPVLLLAGYLAFVLSPIMELHLFGGDMRQYLTNELGISFDQRNALVVGIAMGFAVIPTIFSMAEDAIFSVPKHLTSGSLALGATPWQTLIKVVLLTASPGIFSAVMMGLGRAVGETMIVLMATGNTPIMDWSVFQGMRTLSANIAVEMPESEVGSSHYRILFLAAFVLFVFTFIFNTLAEFVRQRLREKYSSL